MIIVYCDQCGFRIPDGDLTTGAATRVDEYHALCGACSPARKSGRVRKPASGTLPAGGNVKEALRASSTRIAPVRTTPKPDAAAAGDPLSGAAKPTSSRPAALASEPRHPIGSARNAPVSSSNALMITGGIATLVTVLVLGIYMSMGRSEPRRPGTTTSQVDGSRRTVPAELPPQKSVEEPVATPTEPVKTGTNPMEEMRNQLAAKQLDDAKAFFKSNPDDVVAYLGKLNSLLQSYRSTPAGEEAARLAKELKLPGEDEPLAGEADWVLAVDLLALIDVGRDRVRGTWRKEDGRLIVDPEATARIEIPYRPPEEYDFRIRFVRSSGFEDVNQMLTHAGKSFLWSMGCAKNKAFGFELVDGLDAFKSRTAVKVEAAVENGKEYTAVVQVRRSSLKAWLDGRLVRFLSTSYGDLGMRKDWSLRSPDILGLGAHNSLVTFSRVELREVKGKGSRTR